MAEAEYAREKAHEALDNNRSAPTFWHDTRIGDTHALIILGPEDDPLAESNVEAALDILSEHEAELGSVGGAFGRHVGLVVRALEDDRETVAPSWLAFLEDVIEPLEDDPVLDEERYSELEHEQLVEYVAMEVGDSADGPWTTDVLRRLWDEYYVTRPDDVSHRYIEQAFHDTYEAFAAPVLERFHAWNRLRHIGHGQLTMDGGVVTIPPTPDAQELENLTVDGFALPSGIERAVEGTDTEQAIQEALAILTDLSQ